MQMPGRNGSTGEYRYGFNGMESDDEVKGEGNSYDFGARIHDPRVGRFLSIDPKESDYPFMSPYVYAANSPIRFTDENGEGPGDRVKKAKEFVKAYKKKGTKYSRKKRKVGKNVLYADCSSFVTSVLKASGHGDLFKTSFTGSGGGTGMQGEIQAKEGAETLKEPYSLEPKEGDIMMWQGHVSIVTQVTDDEVKFAMMGGSGANIGKVPLKNGKIDITDKKTKSKLKLWGGSNFYGFWTPEDEDDNTAWVPADVTVTGDTDTGEVQVNLEEINQRVTNLEEEGKQQTKEVNALINSVKKRIESVNKVIESNNTQ